MQSLLWSESPHLFASNGGVAARNAAHAISESLEVAQCFQRSVNLEKDYRGSLQNGAYIVTPTALESLHRLAEGLEEDSPFSRLDDYWTVWRRQVRVRRIPDARALFYRPIWMLSSRATRPSRSKRQIMAYVL